MLIYTVAFLKTLQFTVLTTPWPLHVLQSGLFRIIQQTYMQMYSCFIVNKTNAGNLKEHPSLPIFDNMRFIMHTMKQQSSVSLSFALRVFSFRSIGHINFIYFVKHYLLCTIAPFS